MGLYVQSLEHLPIDATRNYYIYLLDYGWSEPLGDVLMNNYIKMASLASSNNAVVIRGTDRVHFSDEVLSWHNFNGEDAEKLLPAILLTNRHPAIFRSKSNEQNEGDIESDLKMILIPLKRFCNTTNDVVGLIQKLFQDIQEQKDLRDFQISREMKRGLGKALADSIILEPNISGVGFSFSKMIKYFTKK